MVVGRMDSVDFIVTMSISTSHPALVSRLSVKSINELEELFFTEIFSDILWLLRLSGTN